MSLLWDQFCLVEVCLAWGGRSITLAQIVLEHGSAMVGFEQYEPLLARARRVLPKGCQVTLLADRGFEYGALLRYWSWAIRVKSDLNVTFQDGHTIAVEHLLPPTEQAYLFPNVSVLGGIACHLATATVAGTKES